MKNLGSSSLKKIRPDQSKAHCFGVTLFLIQYLLSHPQAMMHTCAQILPEISNEPDFQEISHSFSMNQHPYYSFENSEDPLELNPHAMKEYFRTLVGVAPLDYYRIY